MIIGEIMANPKDILARAVRKQPKQNEPEDEPAEGEGEEETEEEAQEDVPEEDEEEPQPRQPVRTVVRLTGQFTKPAPAPQPATTMNAPAKPTPPPTPQQQYTAVVRDLIARGASLEAYDVGVVNNYNGSDLLVLHDINNMPRFVVVLNQTNRDKVLNTLGKAFE